VTRWVLAGVIAEEGEWGLGGGRGGPKVQAPWQQVKNVIPANARKGGEA